MKSKDLLGRGFFPKELIPPFISEGLMTHFEDINQKSTSYNYKKTSKGIIYSMPRLRSSRRKLAIPNPFFQYKLCNVIEANWEKIYSVLELSNASLSKPVVKSGIKQRALEQKFSYSEIATRKILYSVSARYMVYADISRFHGTIYTHSIPWALHSKIAAKANRTDDLYGNTIDKYVRDSQDGQTLGIPTGPDSSFLISEIIASKIDETLDKQLSSSIKRLRYVDDYYFFCKTLSETEVIISQLTKALSEFELELNPDKTRVIELPVEFEPNWVSNLRLYKFSSNKKKQKIDIINYFSKVFSYSRNFPNDFVIKYAITRIKNKQFHKNNWRVYESLLLQSLLSEPSVIQVVLEIFLKYRDAGYNLKKSDIKSTLYTIYDNNIVHSNTYEILWSIWVARSLEININREYAKKLVEMDDPLVSLVIKDMQRINLINSNINTTLWNRHETFESLFSEHWIYAYETYVNGEVSTQDRYINRSTFYKALETNSVRFYDSTRQIEVEAFESFEDEISTKIVKVINEIKNRLSQLEEQRGNIEVLEDIEELIEELNTANENLEGKNGYF